MPGYATILKEVGETPLEALRRYRNEAQLPLHIPLAYAGRLDPMASGKLLVLIGEECKRQSEYHALDKEYLFSVLFGVTSDTGDVLGLISDCNRPVLHESANIIGAARKLTGTIEMPYPHFSSKTVKGKPLHTWTLEGRLSEIEIPTKKSIVYYLRLQKTERIELGEAAKIAQKKIDNVTRVTETSKALGQDFRRVAVLHSWNTLLEKDPNKELTLAHFSCTASSGTYMRSLSEAIAKELGTCGLAFSIHRTKIGRYQPITRTFGFWTKQY